MSRLMPACQNGTHKFLSLQTRLVFRRLVNKAGVFRKPIKEMV